MNRYDLTARMYDMRYEEEQTVKIEAVVKDDSVKDKGVVLDVGCGTGLLFQYIAKKSEVVVGLDISRKTLKNAKKRARAYRNVHLILADADFMPFNNSLFDSVYAFTLIQNMPNPDDTLAEIRSVAKSGSAVVVTGLKKRFSKDTFTLLLETAGLRIMQLQDECNLKCYVAVCQTFHP